MQSYAGSAFCQMIVRILEWNTGDFTYKLT